MKNIDFDFIKEKFEAEGIAPPEALSEENIKSSLEKKESKIIKFKPNNNRFFKSAVSIAAAIALVVVSLSVVNHYNNKVTENTDTPTVSDSEENIIYFTSYDELNKLIKERAPKVKEGITLWNEVAKSGTAIEDYAFENADGAAAAPSSASYSETYKQVDAVDEADIVKTDGEYIYSVSSDENSKVLIFSAENGKTKRVAAIRLKSGAWGKEMFLSGNRLVVISTLDGYNSQGNWSSSTVVTTYNISNKEKPKKENEYTQSGYYTSSRMIGDCVYVISSVANYYTYKDFCIPCATNEDGKFEEIDVKDICAIRDSDGSGYTVIGALDVSSGKKAKQTKAVIGCSETVYCNENNLYVAGTEYNFYPYYRYNGSYSHNPKCTVVKFSFDKTNIKLAATGKSSVFNTVNIVSYYHLD